VKEAGGYEAKVVQVITDIKPYNETKLSSTTV